MAYGPGRVYKLAQRRILDGGGAQSSSINADSYGWLANSQVFYDMTGIFPQPPGFRSRMASTASQEPDVLVSLNLGVIQSNTTEAELEALLQTQLDGLKPLQE
jgi:hypothetical protein